MSTSAPQFTGHTQIPERRLHPRVLPRTLIYAACGESNGGMVLNVSDDGMAISMAIPVGDEAYSNLQVRMNGLAQSIEVHGRMAWTTKSKKRAGIQLVDISDEQRGRIREWLAQEGVRDVNLLPRVLETAGAVLPALADAAITPALLEKPRDMSPVAASALLNPPILAEPQASLLVGLGGTAPEFLGPAQDEPSEDEPPFSENTGAETQTYQGSNPNFAGFRENEWDLASVTMVPRKRSKPEGLSALGLLLLWIAIPSFGIGIMVGRRPLQQWLARGFAVRRNISHVDAPESQIASAREESPAVTGSDVDATGPQSNPGRSGETQPITNSQDVKASAATKSFVSTPALADTKLLNSMSTQELHAIKAPASAAPTENPDANEAKVDSKTEPNAAVAKDSFSSAGAVVKPVTRPSNLAASTNALTNTGNASARRVDSNDKSAVAPTAGRATHSVAVKNQGPRDQGFSKQSSGAPVARTVSVDSGANAASTSHPYVGASIVPASRPAPVMPPAVPLIASSSAASISPAPATGNSTTHQNASGSIQSVGNNASTAATQSVNHSVTITSGAAGNSVASSPSDASRNNNTVLTASKTQPTSASSPVGATYGSTSRNPEPRSASDATPRMAPNVRPNMASSAYAPNSSRSAGPSAVANLAPVNARPPLHGIMLVARKNNESFLLRLPVESVASGRSVSIEMQRFVMMPAESRWHHHGPIAKLAVGELLTRVAPNQVEMAGNARPGDAVTVRAFVDKNGSVEDLKPVSGRFALMPRVMHDVREWQFDQTLIDGKPVESEVNITVEFRSATGPQLSRSGREIQAQNSFKP
ncbi:MAG TPA: PilZ domain-containing protein [Methylomirabilota bacterium]|nr:PilZ domain-containing protein [Methylomirabilota bacterium]